MAAVPRHPRSRSSSITAASPNIRRNRAFVHDFALRHPSQETSSLSSSMRMETSTNTAHSFNFFDSNPQISRINMPSSGSALLAEEGILSFGQTARRCSSATPTRSGRMIENAARHVPFREIFCSSARASSTVTVAGRRTEPVRGEGDSGASGAPCDTIARAACGPIDRDRRRQRDPYHRCALARRYAVRRRPGARRRAVRASLPLAPVAERRPRRVRHELGGELALGRGEDRAARPAGRRRGSIRRE